MVRKMLTATISEKLDVQCNWLEIGGKIAVCTDRFIRFTIGSFIPQLPLTV